ncbi:hypothetical protein [Mesorhizobium sp. DCY119]|uniref:hypothetical protein n=1 Tax=Mesorhizobium sp. DCY119 TaxID=2108445 RepID=UPI001FDFB2FE|nr:hypothetical protein [Mesorhizobium sp. DCY119]
MALDVFEKTPDWPHLLDDAADRRPEMPGVVGTLSPASEGEGLAWISASDEMNLAAPRSAVEAGNIVPDRRVIQRLVLHPGHEGRRRVGFPLDETDSSISGFCDMEAKLQSANAGAERDSCELIISGGR